MVFISFRRKGKACLSLGTSSRQYLLRHHANRRFLYLLLAFLLFCWNSLALWFTQQELDLQAFNLLLWLGVLLALDDHIRQLWPRPSPAGFFAGSLGLAILLALSPWLFREQDGYIKYLLLPIIMFVLALLNRPVTDWALFKAPLLIALLLPLSGAIEVLSSPVQNRLTAFLTWTFLTGAGFQPILNGKQIVFDSGIVAVETPCNGIEQLIFSVSMIVIFQLIYPLDKRFHIFLAVVGAALSATALNVVRIALLAYFTTWPDNRGLPAFDFFHGSGGTIFSLLAAAVAGWIYVSLLERELAA